MMEAASRKAGRVMRMLRARIFSAGRIVSAILLALVCTAGASAQNCLNAKNPNTPPGQVSPSASATSASTSQPDSATTSTATPSASAPTTAKKEVSVDDSEGQQTKRIFWIIPNYRSVSADCQLPPLSVKDKFVLATQDSFDYSAFIVAGMVAGYSMATVQYREFHQGAAGYGRYYWHSFVDQTVGNYFTEAIVPTLTHEDPRYYTLGHGGFVLRTGYALSRLVVTKTDSGGKSFNYSEIVGNAAGAALSNAYYPQVERTAGNTMSKWATQVGIDGIANILKEFWPDIRRDIFHR
jgi:hypothetical protein